MPVGKLSVHEAFVKPNGFGLKMVTLSREVPPGEMFIGVNSLFISAGALTTFVAVVVGDGVSVTVGVFVRGPLGVFVGVRVTVDGRDVSVCVGVCVGVAVLVGDGVNVTVGG